MADELEDDFTPVEADDVLDSFLELESVDSPSAETHATLDIPMSPEQAAQVLQEQERLAELEEGNDNSGEGDQEQVNLDPLVLQLLEAKGIKDGLVQMENEDGSIEEIPFNELSSEEQFNILNTELESNDLGLNDTEAGDLQFLRDNGVTLEQAIQYFSNKAIEDYVASTQNPTADTVAGYSDEEIYALDLLARNKDLTEEEIQTRIDKQREHPDLFKEKVDSLREEYLQLEKDQVAEREAEITRQANESYQQVAESLVAVAKETDYIGGLDIEVEDKQEVLGFILNKDDNGVTEFGKLLEDPKALFEIAWYAKKGKEAFDVIHDYYKKEISEASKRGYEKGKSEVAPPKPGSNLKVAVRNGNSNNKSTNSQGNDGIKSVEDLYNDLIPKTNN